MTKDVKKRILLGKLGLDAHDNGVIIIAKWLSDAGFEVIYAGLYNTPESLVESALQEHPAVLECAVTSAPDPIRGQVVKATIVLAKGWQPSDELVKQLQDHVKHVTAPYKYPRIVEFVPELPKTVSGKIRRGEIRENDAVKS